MRRPRERSSVKPRGSTTSGSEPSHGPPSTAKDYLECLAACSELIEDASEVRSGVVMTVVGDVGARATGRDVAVAECEQRLPHPLPIVFIVWVEEEERIGDRRDSGHTQGSEVRYDDIGPGTTEIPMATEAVNPDDDKSPSARRGNAVQRVVNGHAALGWLPQPRRGLQKGVRCRLAPQVSDLCDASIHKDVDLCLDSRPP